MFYAWPKCRHLGVPSLVRRPGDTYGTFRGISGPKPVWLDVLTRVGHEDEVAGLLHERFGWARTKPILVPNPPTDDADSTAGPGVGPGGVTHSKYITMLDGEGLRNANKMAGVLPRRMLLPGMGIVRDREEPAPAALGLSSWLDTLVFFGAHSEDDVKERMKR